MKSFADLIADGTIKDVAATTYCCKRVSIDEITDKPITILNIIKNIKTEKGEGRTLVHFTSDSTGEGKFFTNAALLKAQLAQIPAECFPITATVVKWREGNKTLYKLT